MSSSSAKIVICLSGKRKSGKDYAADRLLMELRALDVSTEIRRLSEPLKREYARIHLLDFDELLTASAYKELHRAQMVEWSERIRREDPEHFCRLSMRDCTATVCIVSDCRRPSDLLYFTRHFPHVLSVRVECCTPVRESRGFVFTVGVDDADTECALDAHDGWDFVVRNDGDASTLTDELSRILCAVRACALVSPGATLNKSLLTPGRKRASIGDHKLHRSPVPSDAASDAQAPPPQTAAHSPFSARFSGRPLPTPIDPTHGRRVLLSVRWPSAKRTKKIQYRPLRMVQAVGPASTPEIVAACRATASRVSVFAALWRKQLLSP
uniref:Phosphomevalonate kinase n=1 Tax=Plectus sambesii TaxID=2011161 RepID=A0A914WHE2_9BILA